MDQQELFSLMERPVLRDLEAYSVATIRAPKIRLSANENNFGPPPSVVEAAARALASGNRYPDGTSPELREKLAARFSLSPDQIVTSNGLDGLLTMIARAFIDGGDEVLCSSCTFSVYETAALLAGGKVKKIPLAPGFLQDPEGFVEALSPRTKAVFFCDPNNPTGTLCDAGAFRAMMDRLQPRVLVVLDQAYYDFTGRDQIEPFGLLERYPNLIIGRTFSKLYGLAGLRVGWAAAHRGLIERLHKVREPYCVSAMAEAAACAALEEEDYYDGLRRTIVAEREKLCRLMESLAMPFIPSQANFVALLPGQRRQELDRALADRAIAVRPFSLEGTAALRISIGTPQENLVLAQALSQALSPGRP